MGISSGFAPSSLESRSCSPRRTCVNLAICTQCAAVSTCLEVTRVAMHAGENLPEPSGAGRPRTAAQGHEPLERIHEENDHLSGAIAINSIYLLRLLSTDDPRRRGGDSAMLRQRAIRIPESVGCSACYGCDDASRRPNVTNRRRQGPPEPMVACRAFA